MDAVTASLILHEREEDFRDSIADEVETRLYNLSASQAFDLIDEHFAATGGATIIAKLAEYIAADREERGLKLIELEELVMDAMKPAIEEAVKADWENFV